MRKVWRMLPRRNRVALVLDLAFVACWVVDAGWLQ